MYLDTPSTYYNYLYLPRYQWYLMVHTLPCRACLR